jgi:proton-coupled amino acid transporter
LIKGFVGTGIIYLPRAYYNGGYVFSTLCLFFSYLLTLICGRKLLMANKKIGGTFSEMGYKTYGTKGKIAADISIVLS